MLDSVRSGRRVLDGTGWSPAFRVIGSSRTPHAWWCGLEWDIAAISDWDRGQVAGWIALYKRLRPLLPSGDLVRGDEPDSVLLVQGVVACDRSHAVYSLTRVATAAETVPPVVGPARLTGRMLARVGIRPPLLNPEWATLVEIERV